METFRVKVTNDLYVEVIYQMLKALDFVEIQREQPQSGVSEVKEIFSFEEIPMSEVYALGVEAMREEWDTPENRVWNSFLQ
jgi:hypothetical protein